MKIVTDEQWDSLVDRYRTRCLVDFNSVVDYKVSSIASYLKEWKVNTAILGVSGGLDSAVVLALLSKVKERFIPELVIRAYCIEFDIYSEVFHSRFVADLLNKYHDCVKFTVINGSAALEAQFQVMGINNPSKELSAQVSYALRYQMLFTAAQQYGGITIGTTNLDEMGFVGWFGKNSDMVVDVQVLTDWHKFEVKEAATVLGVPDSIINRAPTGDLIDDSTDEENFGCTYDELSAMTMLYIKYGKLPLYLTEKYPKVVALHQKNAHKYQGQTFNPVYIKGRK